MPQISHAERVEHYRNTYALHTQAMATAMGDIRSSMDANAKLDLTPEQLLDHLTDLQTMLAIAQWHAERMRAYNRLLTNALADRDSLS